VNGQDGSFLTELLLNEGYRVVGTTLHQNAERRHPVRDAEKIKIIETSPEDHAWMKSILREYKPTEVYNLAARASSSQLWSDPTATVEQNGLAVARLLDAIHKVDNNIRFVQASSSEIFGNATEAPQTEGTSVHPRNPYGAAKAFGHWITAVYREQRGLFACSCILYNHESPRRGEEFVTRRISRGVAMIKLGLAKELRLGDLDARRDWGFAGDTVRAMWLSLQHSVPGDYVVATGETHSVRDFCEAAFSHVGLKYQDYVAEDRESVRSPENTLLVGNPAKATRVLGWTPTVNFKQLVTMMVEADLRVLAGAGGRVIHAV
jgi:GDPmannose 4,6-dehydratase